MGCLREDDDAHSFKEMELKLGLLRVTKDLERRNDEKLMPSSSVKSTATAFEMFKPNEQGMFAATPLSQL